MARSIEERAALFRQTLDLMERHGHGTARAWARMRQDLAALEQQAGGAPSGATSGSAHRLRGAP